jgi:hypothetical protein
MANDLIPVPLLYMIPLVPVAIVGTLIQAGLYKSASWTAAKFAPARPGRSLQVGT